MGKTIIEKILAKASGEKNLEPGEYIFSNVDVSLGNDLTAPMAIREFRQLGQKVHSPEKVALVPDHFSPSRDAVAAGLCQTMREFSFENKIENFFDVGRAGITHNILPEQGVIMPGDLVIGADPHTCTCGGIGAFGIGVGSTDLAAAMATGKCWLHVPETIRVIFRGELQPWVAAKDLGLFLLGQIGLDGAHYQAIEYQGYAVESLSQDGRFTLCNLANEVGAKTAVIVPDETTKTYIAQRNSKRKPRYFKSDKSARYIATLEYDAELIRPQVAFPDRPGNIRSIDEVGHEPIDQVYIGTCTNGWFEDLQVAAEVLMLARRPIHPKVRLIVSPATPDIYRRAMREGILQIFVDAGAALLPPGCGPCLGGHMGVLGPGERCLSTGSRNNPGRMGSYEADIFLANPAVAAATAVLGHIASPEKI
jgi:3-isopropylmalate/(R)-2-methylmalate dehydratase large subunit